MTAIVAQGPEDPVLVIAEKTNDFGSDVVCLKPRRVNSRLQQHERQPTPQLAPDIRHPRGLDEAAPFGESNRRSRRPRQR
jgi:hypothetical protein